MAPNLTRTRHGVLLWRWLRSSPKRRHSSDRCGRKRGSSATLPPHLRLPNVGIPKARRQLRAIEISGQQIQSETVSETVSEIEACLSGAATMFEPIRGGTRGGQAEFKWTDVSADKDREHYLGHSINAPTGRWQKNKDVHWYSRDKAATDAERTEEIRRIKEAEAEALSVALGFGPTGANSTQPAANASAPSATAQGSEDDTARKQEKEERRRRKAERKEEKRARKEARRAPRDEQHDQLPRRDRSRSRSPPHNRFSREDRRSVSPARGREERRHQTRDYGEAERERERDKHRRLWDMNAARDRPRYRDS